MKKLMARAAAVAFVLAAFLVTGEASQQAPGPQGTSNGPAAPAGVPLPAGYVIGPDDVLTVLFWRDKEMSGDFAVRPDGMISLLLVNDVKAAGLTPEELRDEVTKAASKFIDDPTVTIVVKEINSRKVFVTGMVGKPGPYPLTGPTSVMQLLSMAGGVHEFAKAKNIMILRQENGREVALRFNYNDVKRGRNLKQNVELKPGDTIIVP
ncbi:polysaccharide biosynthesis/export family protein [soil metagenome]